MQRLLDSTVDLLVESGFLYLPLLFDPAVETEIQGVDQVETVIAIDGSHYVKTLSLNSLLANYEKISRYSYHQKRSAFLEKYSNDVDLGKIFIGSKLRTIIFQVMPYFIRKNRGLERKKVSAEEILELIGEKIEMPKGDYKQANTFLDLEPLRKVLNQLDRLDPKYLPLQNGMISALELRKWLHRAIEVQILEREKVRLNQELSEREQFVETIKENMDILLYIAEKGSLEINGFGFYRMGNSDDYLIYMRIEEYILKDYYARSYLFPSCRVAVPTFSPFKPVVIEKYKHPFLYAHESGQEICLHGFYPPQEFSGENAIRLLEEGINALLYGYDARRRNGYHSLDRTREYVKTVEFEDYRI